MDVETAGQGGLKLTKKLADAIPSHLSLKRAPNIDGTWKQTAKKWKERFYIDPGLY